MVWKQFCSMNLHIKVHQNLKINSVSGVRPGEKGLSAGGEAGEENDNSSQRV